MTWPRWQIDMLTHSYRCVPMWALIEELAKYGRSAAAVVDKIEWLKWQGVIA